MQAEIEERDLNMLTDMTAPCKFCKQITVFKWDAGKPIDYDKKVEMATLSCNCDSARWYQDRSTKIKEAQNTAEELFTDPDEASLKKVMQQAAELVIDKNIVNITIVAGNGTKGIFSISASDKIKLKRSVQETAERTL